MNHSELIAACEAGFASVATDSKRKDGVEISSGGDDVPGDAQLRTEPAALYATEELALAAWKAEFQLHFECDWGDKKQTLVWVERPYVESYRITLGDSHGSYRVVRDRFVVRGRVAIEARSEDHPDVPLPVATGRSMKFDPSELKEVKVSRKRGVGK